MDDLLRLCDAYVALGWSLQEQLKRYAQDKNTDEMTKGAKWSFEDFLRLCASQGGLDFEDDAEDLLEGLRNG